MSNQAATVDSVPSPDVAKARTINFINKFARAERRAHNVVTAVALEKIAEAVRQVEVANDSKEEAV